MFVQGIPWIYAAAGGLVAAFAVIALFFLKTRHRERVAPSVMLWRAVLPTARRTTLWRRLSRWRHLAALLVAVAALAAGLTAPVWEYRAVPPVAVVAEPAALATARAIAAAGDPGRTLLIEARTAPVVLQEFRALPLPEAVAKAATDGAMNRSGALELARRRLEAVGGGPVIFCGATAPPWLPEGGVWIQTEAVPEPEKVTVPAWRIFFAGGVTPAALPPGFLAVASPDGADRVVDDAAPDWGALLAALRERRGQYTDALQHAAVGATDRADLTLPRGGVKLAGWLWLAALGILAVDLWLWRNRKVV